MPKEDLFSKWYLKDYQKELEKILDKKDFSADVKNLLLSVLYKIESFYQDYKEVKVDVPSKKEVIEKVISQIQLCEDIILVKPRSEESCLLEKENINYQIDKKENIITCYPNERAILEAIFGLGEKEIKVYDKYDILKSSLQEFLRIGRQMEAVEIIRDFNGWSWTTLESEIENTWYNVAYQNLKILLGRKFLEEWFASKDMLINYVENMENELEEKYTKSLTNDFIKALYKLIIEVQGKNNSQKQSQIEKTKKELEKKLEERKNQKAFIENLSNQKKEAMKQINHLDDLIGSKDLLNKELIEKNRELEEDKQIFSIQHLKEVLVKQRAETFAKMKSLGSQMAPKNYEKTKEDMQAKLDFLSSIHFTKQQISQDFIILQEKFLACFKQKIHLEKPKKEQEKKELIDNIYQFRYYLFLVVEKDKKVKDCPPLQEQIEQIKEILIRKAINDKAITSLANEEKINLTLIKPIFDLRLMELRKIEIEITKKEDNTYVVELYDVETLETKRSIELKEVTKKTGLKRNKKIQLFI